MLQKVVTDYGCWYLFETASFVLVPAFVLINAGKLCVLLHSGWKLYFPLGVVTLIVLFFCRIIVRRMAILS